ncbi:MAG TPA: efflux RND transporter periplasmic adaptor subunit [Flavisolibacter sp.]|nr:efflux RND transporter periplasmic adaptor subunit [Flavisolibacter sp.]
MSIRTILYYSLIAFVFSSCMAKSAPKENEQVLQLPITRLITKDTALTQTYVANIQAIQNVEVRNRVSGFLDKIFVDEGQNVRKGQILFSISNIEYKAAVSKAEAGLSNAEAEVATASLEVSRVKLLVDKKIVSPTDLDVAKASLEGAKARVREAHSVLSEANNKLTYTLIRAPFDGVIDRIPLKVGSLLHEGTLLTTISDISSVYAYFSVSENEFLNYLKEKQRKQSSNNSVVHLTLADGTTYHYPGTIETTASEFEEGTGSMAFRARFPNPHHLLRHGASGTIALQTRVTDALLVPQKSAFDIQDKSYVYVVSDSNTVHMKSFVPRSRIADFYIVQTGLQPGERVLYEGTQNVKDGMRITPQEVPMEGLLHTAL